MTREEAIAILKMEREEAIAKLIELSEKAELLKALQSIKINHPKGNSQDE